MQKFGVIGGGAWGTALAVALDRAGRSVVMAVRNAQQADEINSQHHNAAYLPNVILPTSLMATTNLAAVLSCDVLLVVTPSQYMRDVCAPLAGLGLSNKVPLVLCSKGIEQKTLKLPTEVIQELFPQNPLAVLSGPSFAIEVANDQPTALTIACRDLTVGMEVSKAIGSTNLRPYVSDDLVGVQIGGAVKNVMAIACGIATGRGMGDNARAALMTRGLAEMVRLGVTLGGQGETLMGLSGMGDLVLTCSSLQSRNMSLGVALGQGKALKDILAARRSVAEGVFSAISTKMLADKHQVDMPIVSAVDALLNHGADVGETIAGLLSRPLKIERV